MRDTKARRLVGYGWPGNVRELQSVIERASILAARGAFVLHLEPNQRRRAPVPAADAPGPLAQLKREEGETIARALRQTRGKIYGANGAAALLGVKPTTLASKMARLGPRPLPGADR